MEIEFSPKKQLPLFHVKPTYHGSQAAVFLNVPQPFDKQDLTGLLTLLPLSQSTNTKQGHRKKSHKASVGQAFSYDKSPVAN